ncbi:hypothetical protein [Leptotrichia hongkongensis]|uniref:hypothetical protein n=1 Tax=Leptotrichia hongkongensis TaxID=554406 RepID=UPI0035A896C1
MKHYLRKENGKNLLDFKKYDTDEIVVVVTKSEKNEERHFMYIEPYIECYKSKDRLILLHQENGEIIKEYNMSDIEGIKFLGNTSGFSTMGIFLEQFNLETSLEYEIINSKKAGWYTRNRYLRHYVIFEDTHIQFLSKKNINAEQVKSTKIKKYYIPLKEKLKLEKKDTIYKREYISEFSNKKNIENMIPLVFFLEKKTIRFMGIETYTFKEGKYYEDFIRYTRIYFLFNEKYKIIIEYKSLENENFLILKRKYRDGLENIKKNIFLLENENSEFFRNCYNENGFFENIEDFKKTIKGYTYIADDYILELVVEKSFYPKIKVTDLEDKEYSSNFIFK